MCFGAKSCAQPIIFFGSEENPFQPSVPINIPGEHSAQSFQQISDPGVPAARVAGQGKYGKGGSVGESSGKLATGFGGRMHPRVSVRPTHVEFKRENICVRILNSRS